MQHVIGSKIFDSTRVVVALGGGGVGKTTTSILVGIQAALKGKRVALLSIDPAKRLASALGIPLSGEFKQIALPETSGSLHAAMLDQKSVFDEMVKKHAPSPHIADKILRDPLYISASTNLSGPLEYMALAKLQEIASDPQYDLVVLDTPPDTHALDFLGRPNLLHAFFENKVVANLFRPMVLAGRFGLGKVMEASEKVFGGLGTIAGFSSLKKFGEFILLMHEVIEGFHRSGEKVVQILKSPSTSFMLVTVPTSSAVRSAEFLWDRLVTLGYHMDLLVFNRTLSPSLEGPHFSADDSYVLKRKKAEESLIDELLNYGLRISRGKKIPTLLIEEQFADIHNLESMMQLSRKFKEI